ncbi:MAG: peptidase, zinc-dependent, partial [Bacteroidetes bacterium]|nr:peptidase, zinc-dependent [Bacteroidota bacterium]
MNAIVVGALGSVDDAVLTAIMEGLERAFRFPVRPMPALQDPAFAYDAQRGQYSSVLVLRHLLEHVPDSTIRLLGVTDRDL